MLDVLGRSKFEHYMLCPGVFIMGVACLALLHIRILHGRLPKRFLKHQDRQQLEHIRRPWAKQRSTVDREATMFPDAMPVLLSLLLSYMCSLSRREMEGFRPVGIDLQGPRRAQPWPACACIT